MFLKSFYTPNLVYLGWLKPRVVDVSIFLNNIILCVIKSFSDLVPLGNDNLPEFSFPADYVRITIPHSRYKYSMTMYVTVLMWLLENSKYSVNGCDDGGDQEQYL